MNVVRLAMTALLIAGFALPLHGQEPPKRWEFDEPFVYRIHTAENGTAMSSIAGEWTSLDKDSNQYVYFGAYTLQEASIDLDPGPGENWFHPPFAGASVLSKYDEDDKLIWSVSWRPILVKAIYGDQSGGTYFLITNGQNRDLDPGPGVMRAGTNANHVLFKIDADGRFVWYRDFTDFRLYDIGHGISVTTHEDGSIAVLGWFYETIDLDPDPNNVVLVTGPPAYFEPLSDIDPIAGFVARFDPEGRLQWYRTAQILIPRLGETIPSAATELRVPLFQFDSLGNLYVNGIWDAPDETVFYPIWNRTIHKISPDGSVLWSRNVIPCCESNNDLQIASRLEATLDGEDNLIVTRRVYTLPSSLDEVALEELRTVDVDPGANSMYVEDDGGMNGVTVKLDPNGAFIWAIPRGYRDLWAEGEDRIYGRPWQSDSDPGPGAYPMGFEIVKLNSDGKFLSEESLGVGPLKLRHTFLPPRRLFTNFTWTASVPDHPPPSSYNLYRGWPDQEEYLTNYTYTILPDGKYKAHRNIALLRVRELLMPEVYVDRDFLGAQHGTATNPYNNMSAALSMLEPGGKIVMHASESSETPTLDTPMTITSFGGPSRIGVLPPPVAKSTDEPIRASEGFASRAETK